MASLSPILNGYADYTSFLPEWLTCHVRHPNRPAPKATLPRKKRQPDVYEEADGTFTITGLTVADIAEMRDLLRPSARLFAPMVAAALTVGLDPRVCPKCQNTGQKFAWDGAAGHVRPYPCDCGATYDRTRAIERYLSGEEQA